MKAIECRLPKELDKSFIVYTEKGAYFPCPWHYHPEYELVLVRKSAGKRMVGDHIGSFDAGDLVFMAPGIPHVWSNNERLDGDNRSEAVVIHFTEDFLNGNIFSIMEMNRLKEVFYLAKRGLVIFGNCRSKIESVMCNMIDQTGLQRLSSLFLIFDLLVAAMEENEIQVLASPNYQIGDRTATDRYAKIIAFIKINFYRDICLKEVADMACMSVTAFCNYFKDQFRMTFVAYLNAVRIGHVCTLLRSNQTPIVLVAYQCGFNNLANFNRQFKRLKGMSPSEYRKLVQEKMSVQTLSV
ncbi:MULTISPECIES: AraC family transcriptional regulator [Sphingobacterium]|jgi:AraC-like DNA-binding protein|uniref:AraC family transcriptional regulator n=1 Tax=Sphingobacterium TaxID=28453 RepID=UPI002FDEFDC0